MTDRTWLAVYETLAAVMMATEPYDTRGGLHLLRSIDATLQQGGPRGSHAAARRHLVASPAAGEDHLEAARRSMIRICLELESMHRASRHRC